MFKVALGYDFHRLVSGRKLVLGGVTIPFSKGLLGHSDGDVLSHAIGDAWLSGSGKREIGFYFPDTKEEYKGISSLILLQEIRKIVNTKIINVDAVIICETPKLSPYIPQMVETLSPILGIKRELISLKPKSNEGVGLIGKNEGVAVFVVMLLEGE
jgi:2-C-methyl-D-erythritol 2,4-cyclodiphosphate synthase